MRADKRINNGGTRPGAGKRKDDVAQRYPNENKTERVGCRLYPSQLANIEKQYGSVQKLLDKY